MERADFGKHLVGGDAPARIGLHRCRDRHDLLPQPPLHRRVALLQGPQARPHHLACRCIGTRGHQRVDAARLLRRQAEGALVGRGLGLFLHNPQCSTGYENIIPPWPACWTFGLRGEWEVDYARWQRRDLSARRYVYLWADGVYLQARMEPQAECMLVLMGATPEGKKELVGFQVGVRESAQSWRELLVDLKARGLAIAPELATGDGALGFWKALEEVSPATRHQRCTVHKTANVLDKLPGPSSRRPRPTCARSGQRRTARPRRRR